MPTREVAVLARRRVTQNLKPAFGGSSSAEIISMFRAYPTVIGAGSSLFRTGAPTFERYASRPDAVVMYS